MLLFVAIWWLLLATIWIGPPFYAGFSNGGLWFVPVWSATFAAANVMTGYRHLNRGIIVSLLVGTASSAVAVALIYFLGRGVAIVIGG
jgi:hypothetical protein